MAGTILGGVFRADLSKNRVDVETNNLRTLTFFPKISNINSRVIFFILKFLFSLFHWMVNTSSWWTRDSHDQIPISGTFTAYYGRLQFCYLEWRHYGTYFMYFLRIIYWSNLSITESSRSPTFRWSWTIYLCGMVSWTTKHSVFLWWKWYPWGLGHHQKKIRTHPDAKHSR